MPNWMAALPNIGGAVQRRKVWLTPTTRVLCSNATKTRNLLKFAGVPQTPGLILAVIGLNQVYHIVRMCMGDIAV